MRARLEWLTVITLVFLVGAGWIYLSREVGGDNEPMPLTTAPYIGNLAPDFTLQTHDGLTVTLRDYTADGGMPVVLNFWATWCPPCRVEMPYFENASALYDGRAAILGLNQAESTAIIGDFARAHGLSYPLLADEYMTVNHLYGVLNLPTTICIHKNGVVRERLIGTISQACLEDRINALLDP